MKTILLATTLLLLCHSSQGQNSYSLQFDGTNYIDCGNATAFNLTGTSLTLEAWIYPTSFTTNSWEGSIVTKDFLTYKGWGLRCGGSGILSFFIGVTGDAWPEVVSAAGALVLNKWQHVAGVYNGSTMKIYINGKETASLAETRTMQYDVATTVQIGSSPYAWIPARRFTGKIDEVRVWSRAKTVDEINADLFRTPASTTNLLGYYRMNEGTGSTTADETGNGYTGTLISSPAWSVSSAFAGPGNALDFDGVNDRILFENGILLGTSFTQECWIYPTDATEVYRGILGGGDVAQGQYRAPCLYQYGKKVHFGFGNGSTWNSDQTTQDVLTINKWNHVAVSFDGTTYKLYVNGKNVYNSLCGSGKTPVNDYVNLVGALDNFFLGRIDEVRCWTTTRTAAEIRENMMRTLSGSETGLRAYYRFEEQASTTIYDHSGNSIDGTMQSMDGATDHVTSAAFNTWTGATSTAWNTAANWSTGTVPVATDNTGLYTFSPGNTCSISGSPTVNNIFFSSTGTPVISSGLTVNGNLVLQRNMDLNGQVITLGSTAMLDEDAYRMYGSSGYLTTTRTLSNINAENVAGLGAIITTAANMGSTTINRGHAAQLNSIYRYYDITPANNAALNATLAFSYNDNELNGVTEADLGLFRSTDGGATWMQKFGTVNTSANTITLTGISAFSRWTAGAAAFVLPVNMLTFGVKQNGNGLLLNWSTAAESNTLSFEVQHSINGLDWISIGSTAASGNSTTVKNYSYLHHSPAAGINYYRLLQKDRDGKATVSKTISYQFGNTDAFQLYPNPVTGGKLFVRTAVTSTLYIYSIDGKLALKQFLIAGVQEVDLSGLSRGYYQLRNGSKWYKLIVQ